MNTPGTPLHLAVEIGGAGRHPAAWRLPDADVAGLTGAAHHVRLARAAARGGLDLVVLAEPCAAPTGDPDLLEDSLDAVAIAARVAPVVPGIGLAPQVDVTHSEPFHVQKAIATLDLVSSGRAGWEVTVSRTPAEAALFGRTPARPVAELWLEAAEVIEAARLLWDSWEDDAVVRDAATGRYVDREKIHYADFEGEFFSVKGPSITPRSPQGQPLVVVRADDPEALGVAARWADVVRISAPGVSQAAAARLEVQAAAAESGRDPSGITVLLDVEVLLGGTDGEARGALAALDALTPGPDPEGVQYVGTPEGLAALVGEIVRAHAADGVTFVPLTLPGSLDAIVDGVVPLLVGAGARPSTPSSGTLRERFGLSRPANRHHAEVCP
ncbi:MAG: LLM class flavin-dependent oxidoreductase [Pseudonocardia sp.]|nr:LLM class flavin-dependent oxidoreductase [Pseudonocardia sp.]